MGSMSAILLINVSSMSVIL